MSVGVHVARIVRRHKGKEYETFLLRHNYRENGKVKHQTLGNLSKLPRESIDVLQRSLKGEPIVALDSVFQIDKSLLHGHIALVWQMMKKLKIAEILGVGDERKKKIALALIAARIVEPSSKLSTNNWWQTTTLFSDFLPDGIDADDIYETLDWLVERQDRIEKKLSARHLSSGDLVLYDISSSYVEGKCCSLAQFGWSRDKKKGKKQIVYGIVGNRRGIPISVEVFPGSTIDSTTLLGQVNKVTDRFGVSDVVFVGDRGMIAKSGIDGLKGKDLSFITALGAQQVRALARGGNIQMSLFDQTNLCEISHPDYPNERLVICLNPYVAADRKKNRDELIAATVRELDKVEKIVQTGKLEGKDKIGVRVGKVINRFKMQKHFDLSIEEKEFSFVVNQDRVDSESALDGIYIIRTNVPKEKLSAENAVFSYKSLCQMEKGFRNLKMSDLKVRPLYHYLEDRVKAHLFLCLLSLYVTWHLKQALAPMTFADDQPPSVVDPVAKKEVSLSAKAKARTKKTSDGYPVLSFRALLKELSTLTRNQVIIGDGDQETVEMLTTPTTTQRRAFELIGMPIPPKLS